jgi:hypothetical protein
MIRSIGPLILIVLWGVTARAQDDKAAVKKKAQELGQSLLKGDYAKVVDLTYPKVVELGGGRDKTIDAIRASIKQWNEEGLTIKSVVVDEPSDYVAEGKNTFVILPTTTEIAVESKSTGVGIPAGKIVAKSYLLGISPDGAKTWTFIDGSGMADEKKRDMLLLKLPAKLKLPEQQKPQFIKDKPAS